MKRLAFVFSAVGCLTLACTSSAPSDAGTDAGIGDCATSTDASFSCDVSAVAMAQLGCGDWIGPATAMGDGGYSCPNAVDWLGSVSGIAGGMCEYTWAYTDSPNLCDLPQSEDGTAPFAWLHPACCF